MGGGVEECVHDFPYPTQPAQDALRARRIVLRQAVIDASWVIAHEGEGRFDRGKLFGANPRTGPGGVAGTALGAALAPSPGLVGTFGLDVVHPAFFLLLLLDEARPSPGACGRGPSVRRWRPRWCSPYPRAWRWSARRPGHCSG